MEVVVDDGASAAAALEVVVDDGASAAAALDVVGDAGASVAAALDVVGEDGASAAAAFDVVGEDGASAAVAFDVVGEDGASAAVAFDVVGEDGASAAAALDQKTLQPADTFQYYLDKTTPHVLYRWIGTAGLALLYALRIYFVQGFYFVTYLLGLYIVNLLAGFLSPLVDPETEPSNGPLLPIKGSDEFKPFIRRLPEFKFWYSITKAFCVVFFITFFPIFDVPLYWPIMLIYWAVHFVDTMESQISRMIRYKYIPFNLGKQVLCKKVIRKDQQHQELK